MSEALKKPLFQTLGSAIQSRIGDAQQLQGKALPCSVVAVSGAFVTVAFEINTEFTLPQVTMPIAGSQYIREPLQVGDKGVAIPADALLGGVTGLSGVTSTLQPPSNLGALIFLPLGNVAFQVVDPLTLVLCGPNGVLLQDLAGTTTISITPASIMIQNPTSAALVCGANSVTVTPSGVDIVGLLTINGVPYLAHTHSGVTTGSGVSGPVVP